MRTRKRKYGYEIVCCAGCGRDTYRDTDSVADAYCYWCLHPGATQALPESADRQPLGDPQWFGGHLKHDLEYGHDDIVEPDEEI